MKSVNFWWRCFLLVKITFYAKSVSFWTNEWISKYSDKIMSCKLWGKVTSVSVNINSGGKMSILCKKIEILGEMLTFWLSVHYHWNWLSFLQNMLIFKTMCQNLIKKFNFLGYVNLFMCWFSLKYFICWKIVILIQNIILCNDILGKCHFPSINALGEIEQFFKKGVNCF